MFGGEPQGMTKNLAESRNEAMARLMNEARNKGGNAIIGMRFDTTELGDVWTEICAYGTAVQAVPVTDAQSPRLFRTTCSTYRGLQCGFRHGLGCIPIRGSLITRAPLVTIVT
jgi:Putative heavy-metal-binding